MTRKLSSEKLPSYSTGIPPCVSILHLPVPQLHLPYPWRVGAKILSLPDTTSQGSQEVGEPTSDQVVYTQLRAENESPNCWSFSQTYSAISNRLRGRLVLGVSTCQTGVLDEWTRRKGPLPSWGLVSQDDCSQPHPPLRPRRREEVQRVKWE